MNTLDEKLDILSAVCEQLVARGVRLPADTTRLLQEARAESLELVRQRQELASLYETTHKLVEATELDELLEAIIDKAIVLVGAERGFVVLAETDSSYRVAVARAFMEGEVEAADGAFSSSVVRRVLDTREALLTTNIQSDGRFELSQSIIAQNIRSVLAVPMVARGELQGAIYVDTRLSVGPFGPREQDLLQAMASQAAMAVRGTRLHDDVRRRNQELKSALDELRSTQAALVQSERLAAVGRLAANVAHELRNPLMVMRNTTYFLDRLAVEGKLDSPEVLRRYLTKIDAEIDRQSKIINDLLFFSRNRPRQLAEVDLNALLVETLMRVPLPESVQVIKDFCPSLDMLRADGDQLQQVFINLITNAVHAMPEGGTLTLITQTDGSNAVVHVRDTGVGISPTNQAQLFQPFFTTKEKGIGLGLTVSKSLVEGHRGAISVMSEEGHGTTFTVQLPFELVG